MSNRSTDSREALQGCLDGICSVMGWSGGHAHVLEAGQMVSSGLWHLPAERDYTSLRETLKNLRMGEGTGLAGRVMLTRRPSWFQDVSTEPTEEAHRGLRSAVREAGFRGVLALPVLTGDEVPAVLEFLTESRTELPIPSCSEIMSSIGVQVGRVFERESARARQEDQTRKIESLSVTDELTGLLNRRGFVSMAAQQLKVSRRAKETCHLFFMDVDGLKRINDELGHGAGDAALRDLSGGAACLLPGAGPRRSPRRGRVRCVRAV